MGMYVAIGLACLALGIAVAYFYLTNKNNARVREADQHVAEAQARAERITADATRDAESARKSALVEAREEIFQLRKEQEAEEKKRKSELQSMENRILQREESLDRRNDSLDRKEHQLSSLQGQLDRRKNEVDALYGRQMSELERISALTAFVQMWCVTRPRSCATPSSACAPKPTRRLVRLSLLPSSAAPPTRPARSL